MGPQPQSIACHPAWSPTLRNAAGHLRAELGDAQEPPKVLISAVEDVTPDPLGDCFSHARLPLADGTDSNQRAPAAEDSAHEAAERQGVEVTRVSGLWVMRGTTYAASWTAQSALPLVRNGPTPVS